MDWWIFPSFAEGLNPSTSNVIFHRHHLRACLSSARALSRHHAIHVNGMFERRGTTMLYSFCSQPFSTLTTVPVTSSVAVLYSEEQVDSALKVFLKNGRMEHSNPTSLSVGFGRAFGPFCRKRMDRNLNTITMRLNSTECGPTAFPLVGLTCQPNSTRALAIPHSLFLCTIMKSLSLLLFACLLAVASARPAAFRNAVPVDGTGTRRLVEEIGDHTISRSAKFLPQLVLLDEVQELLSLTCYGSDRFVLVFNDSVPSWTDNFPVLGGTEWGCVDDEGKATSPALYVLDVTTEGNTVELRGRRPELNEVYESFRIDFSKDEGRKRSSATFNAGSYNYDFTNDRALAGIPLFYQDCSSSDLSSKAREFCSLYGTLSNNVTCTNCFAHNQITLSISYGVFSGLTLSASGALTLHAEFDLTVPAEIVRELEIFSRSLPLLAIPAFVGVSLGGYLNVKMTALVGWENQGTLHSGFDMDIGYGVTLGSDPWISPNFQLIKPTGSQGGEVTFRLNFTIGPAFSAKALGLSLVDLSINFNPWVEVDVDFALSKPFPALSNVPTTSDSVLYDSDFVSACYNDHYLDFTVPFGYQTVFQMTGDVVPDMYVVLEDFASPIPLARGCLLPSSSSLLKQVQFLFNGNVSRLVSSTQTFVSLFLQDLSLNIGEELTAGISVSLVTNNMGQLVVNVTLPQGPDFVDTDTRYGQLKELSQDPSTIRNSYKSSRVSQYLVADVPASTTSTTISPYGTSNPDSLRPSSLAAASGVPLLVLVVASMLAVVM
ncbi:hypothetical protein PROFUN_11679 [Planoprotostelium fungivorum]|uniref:Uncharacterized protein n=1 Tax=Planoprotostelium fungivorum TaxID=1890364 RepID=A0A2P6N598_9EUKA|nr:hypothetical protein PROFUN_11679 [Planoprotostelium fungivorum]